ncbi:hypothetical protein M5K25_007863 [Dendrobium thyrsiflorum]|uniref:RNase H type-1 domain-containing protein n=1 Tax=Dendrobium thyrsiflorum TaxID=117978 RepID=A0ABD0VEF9_DENTH
MLNFIVWNVRGIGSLSVKNRIRNLCRIHFIEFLVILEPMISNNKISFVAKVLGFPNYFFNVSNKIWIFWTKNVTLNILNDFPQVINISLSYFNVLVNASLVYAACVKNERRVLFSQLSDFASSCNNPWVVVGDFNTVLHASERKGGVFPKLSSMEEFGNMIMDCSLLDIGFIGSNFTWNNKRLWQRLDRALFNQLWIDNWSLTTVEHLSRSLSDHCPLLINIKNSLNCASSIPTFRFQNMWIQHIDFLKVVKSNWSAPLSPDNSIKGMVRLWFKFKRLKQFLSWWNKNCFKNIFANIAEMEKEVCRLENVILSDPSFMNDLNLAKDNLIKFQDMEETYWKQKASSKLIMEGDRNTKYFHSLVSKKKSLNYIKKVRDVNGDWLSDKELLDSVVKHFSNIFAINESKSSFFTSKSFSAPKINKIVFITHFTHQHLPFKYLGAPIFQGLKKSYLFDDIMKKMCEKISSWEFHFLSYGGRLTILKSVLNSMAFHLFQVIKPNVETVVRFERLLNKFFWGTRNDVKRMHWTSWIKLCGPLKEGGLGCKSIADSITVSSLKMWWNFRKNQSLWAKFMNFKYCKGKHPICCFYKNGDSMVWKRLCSIRNIMEPLIAWGLNSGNSYFWQDNWLFEGSIQSILHTISSSAIKVNNFFRNNSWDIEAILSLVPKEICLKIEKHCLENFCNDQILFTLSNNGNFVFKVAWDHIRNKKDSTMVYNRIWCNNIPTSYSILVWRICKGYIPVDVCLWKKGFYLPSKCQCCYHVESINHVFVNGPIASRVWIWFDAFFNTDYFSGHLTFNHLLTVIFHNTTRGHIKIITAMSLIWFLWLDRNDSKYRNVTMNHNRIIARTKEKINSLYKVNLINQKQFRGFKFTAKKLNNNLFEDLYEPCYRYVIWKKPKDCYIKINTDGSVSDNRYGCGGILRNNEGKLIQAFASPLVKCSVLMAELMALYKVLQICLTAGFFKVWIETDSSLVVNLVISENSGNFENYYVLKDIKRMLSHLDYSISHIWREGNACADFLAKLGASLNHLTSFNQSNIPFLLKGLINLDRSGLPYFRN